MINIFNTWHQQYRNNPKEIEILFLLRHPSQQFSVELYSDPRVLLSAKHKLN